MRIISNFKDYYDHIQWIGGEQPDPHIVYVRQPIADNLLFHPQLPKMVWVSADGPNNMAYEYLYLIVAGRVYCCAHLIGDYTNEFRIVTPETFPEIKLFQRTPWNWGRVEFEQGMIDPGAVELCRKIGQPVFTFSVYGQTLNITQRIPNLAQLGLPKLLPPMQLYQELSYFVGNLIHSSPDIAPASIMDDKSKIVSHGFDIKQSFRHRK